MAEQLPFQANDGGPIPPMDALVDAKTTKSVFTLAWLRGLSQEEVEKSAQVQILQHAKSVALRATFPQWSSGLGYLAFTRKVRVQSPVAEHRDITVAWMAVFDCHQSRPNGRLHL